MIPALIFLSAVLCGHFGARLEHRYGLWPGSMLIILLLGWTVLWSVRLP